MLADLPADLPADRPADLPADRPVGLPPDRPVGPVAGARADRPVLRRPALALVAAALVAAGLAVSTRGTGAVADLTGDALYAALVWVVLALLAPGRGVVLPTVGAVVLCTCVELAQLTGLPAAVTAVWWPVRYVLGTTFAPADLAAYVVGAVAAGAVALGVTGRRNRGRSPGRP